MKKREKTGLIVAAAMAWVLPLLGVRALDRPLGQYLQFPPTTTPYVDHATYSAVAFWGLTLAIFVVLSAGVVLAWPKRRPIDSASFRFRASGDATETFPWWGWCGIGLTTLAWVVAWTRIPALEPVQRHTYTPLWIGFIVTVNAMTQRLRGRCLLTRRTRRFLLLFPVSALFWWYFEYLNRFVQNWFYWGVQDFTAWQYVLFASVSFSTVLPAVLSVEELLAGPLGFRAFFSRGTALHWPWPRGLATAGLCVAGIGLALIGVFPDVLFPLLWLSPLIIIAGIRVLAGGESVFSGLRHGDWSVVVTAAIAALVCGFFWETWNLNSLAKWEYAIPYVHRFLIFEMPVLGYAGYLPFGLECHAVGRWVFEHDE